MFRKLIKKLNNFRFTAMIVMLISTMTGIYALASLFLYHFSGDLYRSALGTFRKVGFADRPYMGMIVFFASLITVILSIFVVYSLVPFLKNKEKLTPRKGLLLVGFISGLFELVLIIFMLILAKTGPNSEVFIYVSVPFGFITFIGCCLYLVPYICCNFYMPEINSGYLLRRYGRVRVNKHDWTLALISLYVGFISLFISIGIAQTDAALESLVAFKDVFHGLAFMWSGKRGCAGIAVVNSLIFYGALIALVCGIVSLVKKGEKERIGGAVGSFFGMASFTVFLSLIYEFSSVYQGAVKNFFVFGTMFFAVILVFASGYALAATYGVTNKVVKAPVVEEVKTEEVKVEEPKVEEKKEEPKPVEEPKKEEPVEEAETEAEEGNFKGLGPRRRRIPFESKVRKAEAEIRARYDEIVGVLREYDVNDRVSIQGETFSYKRDRLVFITFAAKTLKVYFALDPKEFNDSTIPMKDASDAKKFERTPAYLLIKSDLASRRAVTLIRRIMSEHDVPKK